VQTPEKILNFKVKSISFNFLHIVALDFDNNVWVFGNNDRGQLGLGDNFDRPIPKMISFDALGLPKLNFKSIVTGESHTVALDINNNVWTFGRNNVGQLGLGDTRERAIPTMIQPHTFGLRDFRVKSIYAGSNQTMVIDFNDDVWVFGENNFGQLGVGDMLNRLLPTKINNFKAKYIAVGSEHTVALSDYDF
jgi:alpha-tubulin suppressor-like RCC1 family protein